MIKVLCDKIKCCMKPEWLILLQNASCGVQYTPVHFSFYKGKKQIDVCKAKTKDVYCILSDRITKVPTAERAWSNFYPPVKVSKIWHNIVLKFASPMFHLDFRVRHRRIYTGIILHQINKECLRLCSVCKKDDETLELVFLECVELVNFKVRLKELLETKCRYECNDVSEWDYHVLFGLTQRMSGVNDNVVNLILSVARRAIFLRRNLALHEGRLVVLGDYFVGHYKAFFSIYFSLGVDFFTDAFMGGNNLFTVNEGGTLRFNF